jgi:hypothetical protein
MTEAALLSPFGVEIFRGIGSHLGSPYISRDVIRDDTASEAGTRERRRPPSNRLRMRPHRSEPTTRDGSQHGNDRRPMRDFPTRRA